MSEQKLDSHLPDDGNEYLFTDTFPKGTGKGLIVVVIAAVISMIIYNVLPFDINANKGSRCCFSSGFCDRGGAACYDYGAFGRRRWRVRWHSRV